MKIQNGIYDLSYYQLGYNQEHSQQMSYIL